MQLRLVDYWPHGKLRYFFSLKLEYLLFSACEQLSINLQAKYITIQEAVRGAKLLKAHLKSLQSEGRFNCFCVGVYQDSKELTEEPCLPWHRTIPKRFDDGGPPLWYNNPKEKCHQAYFQTLDLAVGEVEKRFEQTDLHIIENIEVLLLKAGNGELIGSIPPVVQNYLSQDFDQDCLKTQPSLVNNTIKTANEGNVPITKVTNVRTIAKAMNTSEIYKTMLSKVYKLLQLYFTFPVTKATAERSF